MHEHGKNYFNTCRIFHRGQHLKHKSKDNKNLFLRSLKINPTDKFKDPKPKSKDLKREIVLEITFDRFEG